MSRYLTLTPEVLSQAVEEFRKAASARYTTGKFTYEKPLGTTNARAKLIFTEIAWLKIQTLVHAFSSEVAWHGTAARTADNEYTVFDIVVYPQEVSGATVVTDQTKYQNWLMSQDDAVFDNLRFQGHSHVDMGVTPSTIDTTNYDKILDQLDDGMFYIFAIFNKKGDRTVRIYDYETNLFFDTADVDVTIQSELLDLEGFLKDARAQVSQRQPQPVASVKSASPWTPKPATEKKPNKKPVTILDDEEWGGHHYPFYYDANW